MLFLWVRGGWPRHPSPKVNVLVRMCCKVTAYIVSIHTRERERGRERERERESERERAREREREREKFDVYL